MVRKRILITGGAGFIGSNLADRLISRGYNVIILDNMSRYGSRKNIDWLTEKHGASGYVLIPDEITDFDSVKIAAEGADVIFHLAGQVAVTSSVKDPRKDFMDNAYGTFNVLEAARLVANDPLLVYTSTNKVYGGMEDVEIEELPIRYEYRYCKNGINENQPLDFHSPYGCSKGSGDQYTRDYARMYGLQTIVLRQSCIYGYRQFGVEDQGWVAWFTIAALKNVPITIYGDGKQVRDILFIDDLIDLYENLINRVGLEKGQIFNIGGGPKNTMSIWVEFKELLEKYLGRNIEVAYTDWRPGDQKVYVSDITKAKNLLDWYPKISVEDGVARLFKWVEKNIDQFEHI